MVCELYPNKAVTWKKSTIMFVWQYYLLSVVWPSSLVRFPGTLAKHPSWPQAQVPWYVNHIVEDAGWWQPLRTSIQTGKGTNHLDRRLSYTHLQKEKGKILYRIVKRWDSPWENLPSIACGVPMIQGGVLSATSLNLLCCQSSHFLRETFPDLPA